MLDIFSASLAQYMSSRSYSSLKAIAYLYSEIKFIINIRTPQVTQHSQTSGSVFLLRSIWAVRYNVSL